MNTATIGSKIKSIRELKNFTQEYMADKLNVSQSTYSRFESDVTDMTISNLNKIAEVLEVSVGDIMQFDKGVFLNNTNTNGNFNSPHSTVNDQKLVDELIKSKDQTIKALLQQIDVLERFNKTK